MTSDPGDIGSAAGLILPGVGAFGAAMETLRRRGILPVLLQKVLHDKTPVLGICLGMQLFFSQSEESPEPGLGWMDGKVRRFPAGEAEKLRVPHVGWNEARPRRGDGLFAGLGASPDFYFCHSYYADAVDDPCAAARTVHGGDFVSAVEKDNLFGVQFHPERSHGNGLKLIRNFLRITQCSNRELSPACS